MLRLSRCVLIVTLPILFCASLVLAQPEVTAQNETIVVDAGHVILDNHYLERPYELTELPNGIDVNGHFIRGEDLVGARRRRSEGPPQSALGRLQSALESEGMLIGWSDDYHRILRGERAQAVLWVLGSQAKAADKADELSSSLTEVHPELLQELAEKCKLPSALQSEMTRAPELQASPELVASIQAPVWRAKLSLYTLTICGMAAAVFALGTLLRFRPTEKMGWSEVNANGEAMQLVVRSVALLVGLGLLDLICTSLSTRTAGFWELNPLGAAVLGAPLLLVAFKVSATAMSGLILFSLRRYHGAQVAAWWLALFCAVLTLRWVTFNSMFMA